MRIALAIGEGARDAMLNGDRAGRRCRAGVGSVHAGMLREAGRRRPPSGAVTA